jgi:hypothetical protein
MSFQGHLRRIEPENSRFAGKTVPRPYQVNVPRERITYFLALPFTA